MSSLVKECEEFAVSKFEKLDEKYKKWYYLHSKYVGIAALDIDKTLDKEIILVSAWLHDVSKVEKEENHAEESAKIAENFLKGKIDEKKLKIILDCIKNHGSKSNPKTKEGKVFQEADKLAIFYPEVRNYAHENSTKEEFEEMLKEHFNKLKSDKVKLLAKKLMESEK